MRNAARARVTSPSSMARRGGCPLGCLSSPGILEGYRSTGIEALACGSARRHGLEHPGALVAVELEPGTVGGRGAARGDAAPDPDLRVQRGWLLDGELGHVGKELGRLGVGGPVDRGAHVERGGSVGPDDLDQVLGRRPAPLSVNRYLEEDKLGASELDER